LRTVGVVEISFDVIPSFSCAAQLFQWPDSEVSPVVGLDRFERRAAEVRVFQSSRGCNAALPGGQLICNVWRIRRCGNDNRSRYKRWNYIVSWEFICIRCTCCVCTIACCLVVGLGLELGLWLDLVPGWLVVMHTYFYRVRLSLSQCQGLQDQGG